MYLVATVKRWNLNQFERRSSAVAGRWLLITDPIALDVALVHALRPRYIFFPHWSWAVPGDVLSAAECICFHMTDVPYGRGGSPLQNLIARGHNETKLSALRMVPELDAGPVYMKRDLSLEGSADEIFERCSRLTFDMIEDVVASQPEPVPQAGETVIFPRRSPRESRLPRAGSSQAIYNHVRMLDAEGYPHAFLDYGDFRLEFRDARFDGEKVEARATFRKAGNS
ncbi:MAG: methionyl-tRNA formyltransferase [Alphaproteobacteria bacterium]|nr:methionyl-tRNA formyltransferase [Alphaproteobacteria bacterium]